MDISKRVDNKTDSSKIIVAGFVHGHFVCSDSFRLSFFFILLGACVWICTHFHIFLDVTFVGII